MKKVPFLTKKAKKLYLPNQTNEAENGQPFVRKEYMKLLVFPILIMSIPYNIQCKVPERLRIMNEGH